MPAPQRSRNWIWWLVGGCGLLIVIGAIGAGFGVYSLVTKFQHGDFSCLPPDFPTYPGAAVVSQNTKVGAGMSPGDGTRCTIVLNSNDDVATVTGFYQSHLNDGDWTVVSSDAANGVIDFLRKSRPQTVGTVTLLGRGQHSEIDIQLDS